MKVRQIQSSTSIRTPIRALAVSGVVTFGVLSTLGCSGSSTPVTGCSMLPPATAIALFRYGPNGARDASFGGGTGIATRRIPNTNTCDSEKAYSAVLQSDGKIMVAGNSVTPGTGTSQTEVVLLRYNTDGTLDPTFANGGIVQTAIGQIDADFPVMAVQTDGKIVVTASGITPFVATTKIILVRYNPEGTLDSGFGTGGVVITSAGSSNGGNAVALQADGKIVVSGFYGGSRALLRYNADGTLDPSFGSGGIVTATGGGPVTVQSDGKIVASNPLSRYNTDGTLDPGFGSGGIVTGAGIDALTIQSDGKIVVAATSHVARYNPDGTLDSGFGTAGIATTTVGPFQQSNAISLQTDGKIVVAGTISVTDAASGLVVLRILLLRYNADGTLDSSFGAGGVVTPSAIGPSITAAANAVFVQPNGAIVVAGFD